MNIENSAARSDYEWGIDRDVIWIRDLDKSGMSVTNNMNAILEHLSQCLPLQEYLLMYCDSTGTWDGLTYSGVSASFFSINETDYGKAIAKLRAQTAL